MKLFFMKYKIWVKEQVLTLILVHHAEILIWSKSSVLPVFVNNSYKLFQLYNVLEHY